VFRASQQIAPPALVPAVPQTGGRTLAVLFGDTPRFGWFYAHPTTKNVWGSTAGGNRFQETLAAFSVNFPETYLALNTATWSINPVGNYNGVWVDAGSTVTGSSGLQSAAGAGVQVPGPTFLKQNSLGTANSLMSYQS
jgi:hypothetical protein